ncbi:Uncharacterised protein [Mycobacteroides abscessus subsp. abscessus]|nr:Uncharacterised protein [Mycobacteroides abscessus subsp. abscessus]
MRQCPELGLENGLPEARITQLVKSAHQGSSLPSEYFVIPAWAAYSSPRMRTTAARPGDSAAVSTTGNGGVAVRER